MCRTTFMPSGIRLQQLIQNQYKEILAREKNNDKFIHLYDIGAYWVAFERSACRLSGLFSKSELTLFRVPDCVEYVVMVSVPADEAEGCLGEYIILHDGIYRKVWSEHVLPMGDYRHWHEMAVRSGHPPIPHNFPPSADLMRHFHPGYTIHQTLLSTAHWTWGHLPCVGHMPVTPQALQDSGHALLVLLQRFPYLLRMNH